MVTKNCVLRKLGIKIKLCVEKRYYKSSEKHYVHGNIENIYILYNERLCKYN